MLTSLFIGNSTGSKIQKSSQRLHMDPSQHWGRHQIMMNYWYLIWFVSASSMTTGQLTQPGSVSSVTNPRITRAWETCLDHTSSLPRYWRTTMLRVQRVPRKVLRREEESQMLWWRPIRTVVMMIKRRSGSTRTATSGSPAPRWSEAGWWGRRRRWSSVRGWGAWCVGCGGRVWGAPARDAEQQLTSTVPLTMAGVWTFTTSESSVPSASVDEWLSWSSNDTFQHIVMNDPLQIIRNTASYYCESHTELDLISARG